MIAPQLPALGFFQANPLMAPVPLPRAISPPQIIFLEQPYAWLPTAINVLQFLLLASLTYHIFRKNYRQKTMERQAEWYHRLVTDFAVEEVTDFTQAALPILAKAAKEVDRLRGVSAPRAAVDLVAQKALAEFKETLYPLMRLVAGRLHVFEIKVEQSFVNKCTGLEDEVAEWFAKEAVAAPGESRVGLSEFLNDWQSDSLKLMRDYEFEQWK